MLNEDSKWGLLIKPRNSFNLPTHSYLTDEIDKFQKKKKVVNQQYNIQYVWKKRTAFPVKDSTAITVPNHPSDTKGSVAGKDYFTEVATDTSHNSLNIKKIVEIIKAKEKPKGFAKVSLTQPQGRTRSSSAQVQGQRASRSAVGLAINKMIQKRKNDLTFSYLIEEIGKKY